MVYNAMKLFMEINPQLFDDDHHQLDQGETALGAALQTT